MNVTAKKVDLIPVQLAEFWVVGLEHHQGLRLWDQLRKGAVLVLEPEPDNKYDEFAIRVLLGDQQVGYVEKKLAKRLSPILQLGVRYKCKVLSQDATAPPYEQILAALFLFTIKA